METVLTANLAFLALLAGIFLGSMAFITPGTGLMEIGSLVLFLVAGYGMFQFGVRWWAVLVLLLGLVVQAYALRQPRRYLPLALGVVLLAAGASFLFPGGNAVSPLVAVGGSFVFGLLMWFMAAQMQVPTLPDDTTPQRLIGALGVARSPIHHEGSVQIAGQLWSARSASPIPEGSEVRVVAVEGLILIVEPAA